MNRITITVPGVPPTHSTWRHRRPDERDAEADRWRRNLIDCAGPGHPRPFGQPECSVLIHALRPAPAPHYADTIGVWAGEACEQLGYPVGDRLPVTVRSTSDVSSTQLVITDLATASHADLALRSLHQLIRLVHKAGRRIADPNPARCSLEPGRAKRTDAGDLLGFLDEVRVEAAALAATADMGAGGDDGVHRWIDRVGDTATQLVRRAP